MLKSITGSKLVQKFSKSDVWFELRKFDDVYIKMFLSKLVGRVGVIAGIGCTFHCIFEYICDFVVCSGKNFIHKTIFVIAEISYIAFRRINATDTLLSQYSYLWQNSAEIWQLQKEWYCNCHSP